LLKEREYSEKDAYRVTSIIKRDFFPENYKNTSKMYLRTYLHDRLLDVIAKYYRNDGCNTYKEKYINMVINEKHIKGHCDLVINDKYLVEVKNYSDGTVNTDNLLDFLHQMAIYCRALGLKVGYLVINNPKQFKEVVFLEVNFAKIDDYLDNYLKEILLIPDYLERFKRK